MTTNFYAPPSAVRSNRIVLPDEEARHARTVLRVQEGDEIGVVDGEGGWYRTQIDHVTSDQVVGTIEERRAEVGEPSVDVTVGIGLLKKRSRFETFVEKAVELGVRRIVPLRTRRTEKESIREDRLRNLMIAAMKQCRRTRLPDLAVPQSPEELLAGSDAELRLCCHAGEEALPIRRAVENEGPVASALSLVGPEGGFAPSEAEAAEAAECTLVSLGARRLRTETAGLVALHTIVAAHPEAEAA